MVIGELRHHRLLIGADFAFGYPLADEGAFFPGLQFQPKTAAALWDLVEKYTSLATIFMARIFINDKIWNSIVLPISIWKGGPI